MDASQYLRRLAEKCPKTVSRNNCVDASQYTQMRGLAATTTYISPVRAVTESVNCCTSASAFGLGNSGSAEPVKLPAGCPSQGICEFFSNRYTTPTITLPGCEYPSTINSYLSPCKVPCIQGTTAEQSRAVKIRVDRDLYDCCATGSSNNQPS